MSEIDANHVRGVGDSVRAPTRSDTALTTPRAWLAFLCARPGWSANRFVYHYHFCLGLTPGEPA